MHHRLDQRSNPNRPRRARQIALSVVVLVTAIGALSISSLALFTDTETVTGNGFTTGTVDISAAPAVAVVTMPLAAPGDQVTAPLTVTNAGSLDLRYSVNSTTTEDILAAELVLTVKSGVTTCDDANWAATGAVLYNGVLGTFATTQLFGSAAPGADAGDRTLTAGNNEVLCVNVSLPIGSTGPEGTTSTATFTFDAEQTKNNP